MRFRVDKAIYTGALEKVRKGLYRKEEESYLKNIYHRVTSTGLTLVAINEMLRIEQEIPVGNFLQVEEQGEICVVGQKLADLVKNLTDSQLIVSSEADGEDSERFVIEINDGGTKTFSSWLPCSKIESFPLKRFLQNGKTRHFSFEPDAFASILRRCSYATATDLKANPVFVNISISVNNREVSALGTDRARFSYIIKKDYGEGNGSFLVFWPIAKEIVGLLDGYNIVNVYVDDNLLKLQQGPTTIYARQSTVEFPNWRSTVDNAVFPIQARVSKADLMRALKNILVIVDYGVKLTFDSENATVSLEAISSSEEPIPQGSGSVIIPCEVSTDLSVSVTTRYLLEAINNAPNPTVEIHTNPDPESTSIKLVLDDGFENLISKIIEE